MINADLFVTVNNAEYTSAIDVPFIPVVGMTFLPDSFESGISLTVSHVTWDMQKRRLEIDFKDVSVRGNDAETREFMGTLNWRPV